jgi:hypothetical protein
MNKTALTLASFNALLPNEEAARRWFERARWPEGPVCGQCGSINRSWRLKTRKPSAPHKSGRGPRRPLVLVAAQRGGAVVAKPIPTHSRAAIGDALDGLLSPDATVMTDGLPAYKQFARDRLHLTVTHSAREYARTDLATGRRVHVNRVESFNSMFRRAVAGVWHYVSAKHLNRYAGETTFRLNHGDEACLARMGRLIRNGEGARLPYADLVEAA